MQILQTDQGLQYHNAQMFCLQRDEVLQQILSESMLHKTNFVECWSYGLTQAHVSSSDAMEAVQKGQHRHRGLCRNANGVFRSMPSF